MRRIIIFLACLFLCLGFKEEIHAQKVYQERPYLYEMHATAYCLEGKTYTGEYVREGIAACGRKDWIGKTVALYGCKPDGTIGYFIGVYEILDTGCANNVIDVWQPENKCQSFMDLVYEDGCRGKVYVQILDAEG